MRRSARQHRRACATTSTVAVVSYTNNSCMCCMNAASMNVKMQTRGICSFRPIASVIDQCILARNLPRWLITYPTHWPGGTALQNSVHSHPKVGIGMLLRSLQDFDDPLSAIRCVLPALPGGYFMMSLHACSAEGGAARLGRPARRIRDRWAGGSATSSAAGVLVTSHVLLVWNEMRVCRLVAFHVSACMHTCHAVHAHIRAHKHMRTCL